MILRLGHRPFSEELRAALTLQPPQVLNETDPPLTGNRRCQGHRTGEPGQTLKLGIFIAAGLNRELVVTVPVRMPL